MADGKGKKHRGFLTHVLAQQSGADQYEVAGRAFEEEYAVHDIHKQPETNMGSEKVTMIDR